MPIFDVGFQEFLEVGESDIVLQDALNFNLFIVGGTRAVIEDFFLGNILFLFL